MSALGNETSPDIKKAEYLYVKYKKKLLSVAMSYMHNMYDSEDALHSTFEKLLNNTHLLVDDVNSIKTQALLTVMIKNVCLNMIRERKKITYLEDIAEYELHTSENIEKKYETRALFDEVVSAINGMDDIYKDALTLKYLNDMSITDIAIVLGVNYQTAAKRIQRGEKILKNKFGKEVF